ncbi:low temperature requirement protein LtrA [Micromonospora luteifusca]|uniref:Low temperature requirement protein LtrA n=1 Tax=Micromonospora luteifusca TaxID=709860 RepID=A0ABS2M042_9ACTN|nr:low temperature requirement protein A [Micromonospora luteifusca]MBM7493797.1 low temperature requirement protein LtrA [Micromonospora luteifusca]
MAAQRGRRPGKAETRQPPTRGPGGPQRTDLLELFFDLAFVAGLAMTSQKMATELTWISFAQGLLALSTLWAVWVTTTLITDTYSPRKQPIPILILAAMFGLMLMAAALPGAFGDHGLFFGGTWAVIIVGRGLVLIRSLRGRQEQERTVRALVWGVCSGSIWVVGGLVPDPGWRLAVWLAALAVDYTGYGLRFPIPGRPPLPVYQVASEHLAERYQQIYILAVGELILISVLALGHQPFTGDRLATFVVAFLTAVVLWWSYARGAGATLRAAIDASPHRTRLVQTNPYAHWLMIVGVVATAAGVERIMDQPGARTGAAMTALILGGAGLFLCGRAVLEHEAYERWPLSHVIGVVATIALASFTAYLPGLAVSVAAGLVLLGVAVGEFLRMRRRPVPAPVSS